MTLNLATLFEAVAAEVADRPAISCGGERRTYAELDRRADQLAAHLSDRGVRPGQHVGVHMLNAVEYVETMLACFKARAVPINVNYRYTESELLHIVNDAEMVAVVVEPQFVGHVAAVAADASHLRHVLVTGPAGPDPDLAWPATVAVAGYEEALAAQSGERLAVERTADDHFVLYTGGTTGAPKGVVWRHEDFYYAALMGGNAYGDPHHTPAALAAAAREGMVLTYLIAMPLMHGAASYNLLVGLFAGAHLVLLPKYDATELLRLVEQEKVNVISLVGDAQARPLVDVLRADEGKHDLASLFVVGSGGAILSQSVIADIQQLLPDVMVRNSFGSSESGADGVIDVGEDGLMRLEPGPGVLVVDEARRPMGPGSDRIGHLARSGHVPVAYYNDPQKSAATFPEIDGTRWVVPGDLARHDQDGRIVVLGRGSTCINTGGEKVFVEEVEQALKGHPVVMDSVVAGIPDERFGERVAAVVELREGSTATVEALRTHCRQTLAGYKIPATINFVEAVLRSPSGKADYRWAKDVLTDPVR